VGYKGKRIIYCSHALKRAKERGISQQDILDVIESPDVDQPSKVCLGRRILRKRLRPSYVVSVVIVPPNGGSDVGVITAWVNEG